MWSSKIHQFLKPRRHILVEPQEDLHKPWLRPLLDVPGTRYHLAHFRSDESPWRLDCYKDKGLLLEQEDGPVGSTGANGKRKLLILANLSRYSRLSSKNTVPGKKLESQQKVYDFTSTIEQAFGFHSNGPARMLTWMLDTEKTNILPRTTSLRRRYSVLSERSCHAEEIVGSPLLSNGARREARIELESCIATAKRMSLSCISIPSSRLDEMPRRLREDGEEAVTEAWRLNEGDFEGHRVWQRELLELRKAFANGEYSQFVGGPPGWVATNRARGDRKITPEYLRFRALETMHNSSLGRKAFVDNVLQLDEEIRKKELALVLDTGLNDVQRADRNRDLDLAIARYRKLIAKQPRTRLAQALFFADDRAAWNSVHPLLMWDRRTAEPIIAHTNEFHSPRPLALLDFEPKSTALSTLTELQQKYLDAMLLSMFFNPVQSVADALNGMTPGAADALIPQCPSLHDPLRGGRRDKDQLRVRLLTLEMIRDLAVAMENWKFSPTLAELKRNSPYNPFNGL